MFSLNWSSPPKPRKVLAAESLSPAMLNVPSPLAEASPSWIVVSVVAVVSLML